MFSWDFSFSCAMKHVVFIFMHKSRRKLLSLQEKDRSKVSRLFAELISENEIVQTEESAANNVKYKRLKG